MIIIARLASPLIYYCLLVLATVGGESKRRSVNKINYINNNKRKKSSSTKKKFLISKKKKEKK